MDIKRVRSIAKAVNQVTVEGANLRELFADLTQDQTDYDADGTKTTFNLGYLWQTSSGNDRLRVYLNDGADSAPPWGAETEQTVGLAGSDTLGGTIDVLWDPAARTLEWDTAPGSAEHSFRVEGDRLRPLIARRKNETSIAALGRIYGRSVKDQSIVSDLHADLRAMAELAKDSSELERITLTTTQDGIQAGLNLGIVNLRRGIGAAGNPVEYLVDKVTTRLIGGQVARYDVALVVSP